MKYIWEESDIKGGRRIAQANEGAEQFIIGYDGRITGTNDMCVVSLSDGAIILKEKSKAELAKTFTELGYKPLDLR